MKLDIQKWNSERISLETQIKALKKEIKSQDGISWQQYRLKMELKKSATALYCLRAALRNREHTKTVAKEEALKLLQNYSTLNAEVEADDQLELELAASNAA